MYDQGTCGKAPTNLADAVTILCLEYMVGLPSVITL